MGRRLNGAVLAAVAILAAGPTRAAEEPPKGTPAVTVRVHHPEAQGEALLGLFRGARSPHPAAALAAWTHANGGRARLRKGPEAAIAALNPPMLLREVRGLDGAVITLGFAAGTARPDWRAVLPNDDGSLAALATALALTDGAVEEPIGTRAVLRLGPPGSALATGRALASSREGLRAAVERPAAPGDPADTSRSGWRLELDPRGLRAVPSVPGRRIAAALDAAGCRAALGWLALADETLSLEVRSRLDSAPRPLPAIDPAWLDAIPASGVLAAFCCRLNTAGPALDAAFAWLDRVEKADPARAGVAPLRTRINLLAAPAWVRPEIDLWPDLRGLTVALLVNPAGEVDGCLAVLHTVDPSAADRIASRVLPRLASVYVPGVRPPDPGPVGIFPLGRLAGKPLAATARGDGVRIVWGDRALADAPESLRRPAAPALWAGPKGDAPARLGALWVGRLRAVGPPGSPLALALADAPPVVWEGRTRGGELVDLVRWTGLRGVVRRWLDAVPLDPPPDR